MSALPRHPLWLLLRASLHRGTPGAALPADRAEWQAAPLDARHRARFNAELGFAAEALPLSYHYLALQRAQLDWMARPGFPYRLLGMVHMAQSLQRVAPWQPALGFTIRMAALREGKRNLLICAEFLQDGAPVLRAESLYRPPRDKGSRPLREPATETPPAEAPLAQWPLPADLGRRYAWLSGDFNPIHLGGLGAKLFGLKAPLIHGMHTAARCEAELAPQGAQQLEIRFLRPLTLPGEARLHAEHEGHAVWGAAGRCATVTVS
jgi:acyl dehydratase